MKPKTDPFTWFISLLGYLFLLMAIASAVHWLCGCETGDWITRDREYILWRDSPLPRLDGEAFHAHRPAAKIWLEPGKAKLIIGRDLYFGESVKIPVDMSISRVIISP